MNGRITCGGAPLPCSREADGEFHGASLGLGFRRRLDIALHVLAVVLLLAGVSRTALARGTVVAWGDNSRGQTNVPAALTNVAAISAGGWHTLALLTNGSVLAWGDNSSGQTNIPNSLTNVVAIGAGGTHSMVLRADGTVVTWGGAFSNSTNVPAGLTNVVAIAAGWGHCLALRNDGSAVAWGWHWDGTYYVPVTMPDTLTNIVAIAGGAAHSLAIRSDGAVIAWGVNMLGATDVPVGLTDVVGIAAGATHGLALKSDGTVVAWGGWWDYTPDLHAIFITPTPPAGLSDAVAIAASWHHCMALRTNGAAVAWGEVFQVDRYVPATVPGGLTNAAAIAAGGTFALAVTGDGLPVRTAPLMNRNVAAGGTVFFRGPDAGARPLRNQWYYKGFPIQRATNTTLLLTNVQPDQAGEYSVILRDTSNAVSQGKSQLYVVPFWVREPPQDHVALAGETVTFRLGVEAYVPLEYQWSFNGANLPDGTNAVLVLSNVVPAQAGNYSVSVRHASGAVATEEARLSVLPFALASQPSNQIAILGGAATFTVGVQAFAPVILQWRLNGFPLPGATNASLMVTNVQFEQDGAVYSVVLSNAFDVVTSAEATLTVRLMAAWTLGEEFILPNLTNVVAMAGGPFHTLALYRDRTVVAWGDNAYGKTNIPTGLSDVVAIAAGSQYSLALRLDGTVVAWGDNFFGQCNVPSGLSNVVAISAGISDSLALRADGTVVAWADSQADVPVGLTNVVAVAAGGYQSLALLADGNVVAWGKYWDGQFLSPLYVPAGLSNVVAIAAGMYHCLALCANGTVTVWGNDQNLQSDVPVELTNVVAIAGGDYHSLALRADGSVVAWGDSWSVPDGLGNVAAIADGGHYSLALAGTGAPFVTAGLANRTVLGGGTVFFYATASGALPLTYQWQCNGTNVPGATNAWLAMTNVQPAMAGDYAVTVSNALGVATSPSAHLTVPPGQITAQPQARVAFAGAGVTFSVDAIANAPWSYQWRFNGTNLPDATNATLALSGVRLDQAGAYSVVLSNVFGVVVSAEAVLSVNNVAAWGYGWYGEAAVPGGTTGIVSIAAGGGHNLALRAEGTLVGWGYNYWGQANAPIGSRRVVAVSAGPDHSLALQEDGRVLAWGYNRDGQCNAPAGLTNAVAIAAGGLHSLALRANGTVAAWGANGNGQTSVPQNLTNVVGIVASYQGSLALRANGTVVGWGASWDSQTRNVEGLTNVVAVAAGYDHALALRADGAIVMWGQTNRGQADIPAGLTNVVAISAGNYYSLALQSDGTVVAWGANDSGQINVPVELTNVVAISGGSLHGLALIGDGPPVLTLPLADRTVLAGDTACFSATASGTWPLHFQWRCNGTNVPGATNRFLVLTNVLPEQAGVYSVTVSNAVGMTNSLGARLDVPSILIAAQPQSRMLLASEAVTFTVVGQSVVPWTAQWRFNGTDLPDATNAVLTLTNLQVAQSGTYSVVLSNVFGAVTSAPAVLVVLPVRITAQPQNRGGFLGGSAAFSVSAEGPAPWTHQWKFNGTNLPGATNASLAFTNLDSTQAGRYSVTLSNAFGEISSVEVVLSVGWVAGWGNGFTTQNAVFADETNLVGIAGGGDHSLGVRADGTVTGWGSPFSLHTNLPPDLTNVIVVADSDYNSLSLRADGTLVAWGELRNGVPAAPQPPPGLSNLVAVAAGWDHSLALRSDGTVVAWGDNRRLQLWIPPDLTNVVAIAAGNYFNLALRADGTVVTWGGGQRGVLTGLTSVVSIAARGDCALALRADTTVAAWGGNYYGQSNVPEGLSNVVAIAVSGGHSLALRSDDTVVAWGRSYEGQTIAPAGLSNVVAITAGAYHSLALIGHGPPSLRAPLLDRSIPLNGTVFFRMAAAGARPLHYQWLHDGVVLPGATNPVLVLTNVAFDLAGAYSVTVSNALGSATSREARLRVIPPEGRLLVGSLRWTNDQVQFAATSPTGLVWTVQASSNLARWTDLVTLTNLTGTVPFTDSGANLSRRFYRLRLGP